MTSTKYDLLIQKSVGNKHLLGSFCYYDSDYLKQLKQELERYNCLSSFTTHELKPASNVNDGRIKMCSVASSSRLGFLYGVQTGVCNFEKSDIHNSICNPNYDNYDENTNTFYEYKCHEFTSNTDEHIFFKNNPESYKSLLKKHFNADYNLNEKNIYSAFDIQPYKNFDFKQFICHLLGLLSVATKDKPVKLQYIMFIPNEDVLENEIEAKNWIVELENHVRSIFLQMSEKQTVTCSGEIGILKDFIELSFKHIYVSDVHDFVYEQICKIKS